MSQRRCLRFLLSIQVLLLAFSIAVKADSPEIIDSLTRKLEVTSGVEKLQVYKDLISNVRNINPARGIDLSRIALKMADSLSKTNLKAQILNEEGVCYRKLNIPERALQLHFDALQIFEKERDSTGIAFTLANIGNVYHSFGDYENALEHHFRALYLKEYLKDESQIAYSQNAIGMVLVDMGEYSRAMDFYISAMTIYDRTQSGIQQANVYANMGKVMVKMGHYTEAMGFLEKAAKVYTESDNLFGMSLVLNQTAELLFRLEKYDDAIEKLKQAEQISKDQHNFPVLHFNYKLQKDIYKKKGAFVEALEMAELTSMYKDSLFFERKNYELTEIMVRYETSRLDTENEILRLQLKEQNLRLRSIIIGSISLLFILTIFLLAWQIWRNRKVARSLEILNQDLEQRVEERTSELKEKSNDLEQAFNALKQSEEMLRAISDTAPFGIIVTNKEGVIIFHNEMLFEASGLQRNEFEQGTWFQHILHEDRSQTEMIWKSSHNYEKPLPDTHFRLRNVNQIKWMRIKGKPLFDQSGYIGSVILMENVTENKKFEQDLIIAKNRAEESDKVKSAFLANMSHEIRTPMNAILGFADLLASDEYTNEEKVEFVDMIRSSGKLLLNLINDIIDISKIEAGELKIHPSTFNLQSLLKDLAFTFRQQLDASGKKDVKIILTNKDIQADEPITTDKLRLQQIITNLLSNAIKFTHMGQIEFGVIRINDQFEFFVKDTGIGIPESKLDVIFERFRQADDSHTRIYGGTGLGLAITKNLTHMLGGEIWVESVENKGTAFYFTLPAVNGDEESMSFTYPDYSKLTILVAEDVETNFQLINNMLQRSGAKVIHAINGLIAIDMALEHQPDIVFMDIQMPDMDGKETLLRLRQQNFDNPVIAITAFALSGEEKNYIEFGFDSYLSKPLGIEKLYSLLKIFVKA